MKPLSGSGERTDLAVILARGASSRMGTPKGLVRLPDDPRPFLARIVDQYRKLEMPVVVVARQDELSVYGKVLGERPSVELVAAQPGGGTGRTLAIAWNLLKDRCSHLWAHPVDLPLVKEETLRYLYRRSLAAAAKVIRPTWEGSPGHPVILPCGVLAALDESLGTVAGIGSPGLFGFCGDMKELLSAEVLSAKGFRLEEIEAGDPGVIRDFDVPHSF